MSNTKKIASLISALILAVSLSACGQKEAKVVSAETIRTVKVDPIKESKNQVQLDYIGTVDSKNIVKYGFKSPGKIRRIYVDKGDKVRKGDKLAELDTQDLTFAVNAAKAQMDAAKAQYDKALNGAKEEQIRRMEQDLKKAQNSYDYVSKLYEDMKKIYDIGSVSKQKLDEVKLKYDTAEATLNQATDGLKEIKDGAREEDKAAAQSQYLMAKTAYEQKVSLLNDAVIYANQGGSIVKKLFEEGELISQGYPVVVLRSTEQVVNVGIAQKDLKKLKVGTKAIIDVDGIIDHGEIINIAEAPDEDTRMYNAEISVKEKTFHLGSIAKLKFNVGDETGIWIPINSVMSDGEDYVYIAEEDRVLKRNIVLGNIKGNNVMVEGIKVGDKLIVEGMKNLKDGYKVYVVDKDENVDKADKEENKVNETDNVSKKDQAS